MTDVDHMRHALLLASRALGSVAPNPAVGCVIVSNNQSVVGRGWTASGGRPHAEAIALAQAGSSAREATAYVTLEPCAHHGQTPPCAEALIRAGVRRVVAAATDPDPRVNGKGLAILRAAGVEVIEDVLRREAESLNRGFFLRMGKDRPQVTLKIAQDQNGKTIPPPGKGRWITNEEARRFGHLLRARHDAILIGIDTALADDPELTCRVPGLQDHSPVRVVLDTHLRLPKTAKLVQTAIRVSTLVFTTAEGGEHLRRHGVEVLRVVADAQGRPALMAVLGVLAGRGYTRLLIEGGASLISACLLQGFADQLEIFTALIDLGEAARGEIPELAEAAASNRFARIAERRFGPDMLETWAAKA